MTDSDHEKLKAEMNGIIKNIDNTLKKIENIIPVQHDVPDRPKNDTLKNTHNFVPKK